MKFGAVTHLTILLVSKQQGTKRSTLAEMRMVRTVLYFKLVFTHLYFVVIIERVSVVAGGSHFLASGSNTTSTLGFFPPDFGFLRPML